jgi:hypothetical protein
MLVEQTSLGRFLLLFWVSWLPSNRAVMITRAVQQQMLCHVLMTATLLQRKYRLFTTEERVRP